VRDLLTPKCLNAVVLVDVDLPYWTSKVEHLVAFAAIVSNILLRMRRNGYLGTSGKNCDTIIRFPDPDFLTECTMSAIWRRFPLIFAFIRWKFAIFLLPVYFTNCAKFEVDIDNNHPLPSYCVLAADTLRDTLTSSHTWRVTWSTLL